MSGRSQSENDEDGPRDRFITVYGRKPVLEALAAEDLSLDKVLISDRAGGAAVSEIMAAAAARDVRIERVPERRVGAVARNTRHHQGVVADVIAPAMRPLTRFLDERIGGRNHATTVMVLDRVQNPANVGMIIRSALGAGLHGIVIPSAGTAAIGPLVIKASAGTAFHAPILTAPDAPSACALLAADRFTLVGLDGDADESIFEARLPDRLAVVVGNETEGLSEDVSPQLDRTVAIPTTDAVESLNVACAAAVVAYALTNPR